MKRISFLLLMSIVLFSCKTKKEVVNASANQETNEESVNERLHDIWALQSIANTQFETLDTEKRPTMELNLTDLKASGFLGCNNFGATLKVEGSAISFGNMFSTKKLCNNMELENLYSAKLQEVNKYELKGLNLYLYKDKELLLSFKKVD